MTISIIIITYNRKDEIKELLQKLFLIRNDNILEIIVVDNNSHDDIRRYLKKLTNKKLKVYFLEENRGVAGGRNYGIKKAKGDILLFLDDDALLIQEDDIYKIEKKFKEDKNLGVLAFKIKNYYSKKIEKIEYPFTNKNLDADIERLTGTYIGAGHAIKREVFFRCGYYPEEFFYGMEELDLSIRIINLGYKILYFPQVGIYHKQSLNGRITSDKKWIFMYRNRLIINKKYFNKKYNIVSSILWFLRIFMISRSFLIPCKGIYEYLKIKNNYFKLKLNDKSIEYIKENFGRIWY